MSTTFIVLFAGLLILAVVQARRYAVRENEFQEELADTEFRLQKALTDRHTDMEKLQQLEANYAASVKEYQIMTADRDDLYIKRNKLTQLVGQIPKLEDESRGLRNEATALRNELEIRTSKYHGLYEQYLTAFSAQTTETNAAIKKQTDSLAEIRSMLSQADKSHSVATQTTVDTPEQYQETIHVFGWYQVSADNKEFHHFSYVRNSQLVGATDEARLLELLEASEAFSFAYSGKGGGSQCSIADKTKLNDFLRSYGPGAEPTVKCALNWSQSDSPNLIFFRQVSRVPTPVVVTATTPALTVNSAKGETEKPVLNKTYRIVLTFLGGNSAWAEFQVNLKCSDDTRDVYDKVIAPYLMGSHSTLAKQLDAAIPGQFADWLRGVYNGSYGEHVEMLVQSHGNNVFSVKATSV